MRLDLDWHIEVLDDCVDTKGDAAEGPEEHHCCGEAEGGFRAVVAPDLGDELDAPASVGGVPVRCSACSGKFGSFRVRNGEPRGRRKKKR